MSLLDELNTYYGSDKDYKAKGRGRQLFLAQKDEIKEALDAGYPMTEVWKYLQDKNKMPIVYRVFVEYVHRFIHQSENTETIEIPEKIDHPFFYPETTEKEQGQ